MDEPCAPPPPTPWTITITYEAGAFTATCVGSNGAAHFRGPRTLAPSTATLTQAHTNNIASFFKIDKALTPVKLILGDGVAQIGFTTTLSSNGVFYN